MVFQGNPKRANHTDLKLEVTKHKKYTKRKIYYLYYSWNEIIQKILSQRYFHFKFIMSNTKHQNVLGN